METVTESSKEVHRLRTYTEEAIVPKDWNNAYQLKHSMQISISQLAAARFTEIHHPLSLKYF